MTTPRHPDPAGSITTEQVSMLLGYLSSGAVRDARGIAEIAMATWIGGLEGMGSLPRIEHCDEHRTPFLVAWNALADRTSSAEAMEGRIHHLLTVADKLSDVVLLPCIVASLRHRQDGTPPDLDDLVRRIHSDLVAGGIAMVGWETCDLSGMNLSIRIDGWRPTMGRLEPTTGEVVPTGYVPPPPIDHVAIDFEGGPVLVADWIRIPEFTETVQAALKGVSLESEDGLRTHVKHYASMGFVSVYVGNTGPSIVDLDGKLVVGSVDTEMEGYEDASSVCTDMWRVTMIERSRLVDIVAQSVGPEKAEAIIDDYIAKHGVDATLEIPAGAWHLYFTGDNDLFAERFHSEDLPLPEAVEPFFVLSPEALTLSPRPTPDRDMVMDRPTEERQTLRPS